MSYISSEIIEKVKQIDLKSYRTTSAEYSVWERRSNREIVMYSITIWIERRLGLKVNATKMHITPPSKLKYLGFGFWKGKDGWKARLHEDSVEKLKRKLKQLCKRSRSVDLTYRIKKITAKDIKP